MGPSDFKKAGGDEINYQSDGLGVVELSPDQGRNGRSPAQPTKPLSAEELSGCRPGAVPGRDRRHRAGESTSRGAHPVQVKMSGPILAAISRGLREIKMCRERSAPHEDQPGPCNFPAKEITPVHRSDGSGIDVQLHPLSQSRSARAGSRNMGEGTTVSWTGGIGRQGQRRRRRLREANSLFDRLCRACLRRPEQDGIHADAKCVRFVRSSPNAKTFAAAAATADWLHARDFNLVMTNAPGAGSYPIAATTFVLNVQAAEKCGEQAHRPRKFFNWALTKGQPQASSLDYAPLPAPLVKRIQSYVGSEYQISSASRAECRAARRFRRAVSFWLKPRCRARSPLRGPCGSGPSVCRVERLPKSPDVHVDGAGVDVRS